MTWSRQQRAKNHDYERGADGTLYCKSCGVELGSGHEGWGPPPVRLGPPYCSVGTATRIRLLEVSYEALMGATREFVHAQAVLTGDPVRAKAAGDRLVALGVIEESEAR